MTLAKLRHELTCIYHDVKSTRQFEANKFLANSLDRIEERLESVIEKLAEEEQKQADLFH